MAGGIDWFRWHHGSVTDPKFGLVAKKANARLGDVIAVWAYVLESASASDARGTIGAIDFETLDFMFCMEEGTAMRILDAMTQRGLLGAEGVVVSWEKRQPKREREDDTAAERKRRQREREGGSPHAAQEDSSPHVTPCHATSRQKTPRGEESREEEIPPTPDGVGCHRPSDDGQGGQAALTLVSPAPPAAKSLPECPHLAVLALWAEVLPDLPQHEPGHWTGSRADHLRARWRETAKAKRWQSQADGLAYFRRLFTYVGQSAFLTGKAHDPKRRPFFAKLAWVVEPETWAKLHEGEYHTEAA